MSCYGIEDKLQAMAGRTLKRIRHTESVVVFEFTDGDNIKLEVLGDCCSNSTISGIEYTRGEVMAGTADDETTDIEDDDNGCTKNYRTTFHTKSGNHVIVDWKNESNGYYGGFWA